MDNQILLLILLLLAVSVNGTHVLLLFLDLLTYFSDPMHMIMRGTLSVLNMLNDLEENCTANAGLEELWNLERASEGLMPHGAVLPCLGKIFVTGDFHGNLKEYCGKLADVQNCTWDLSSAAEMCMTENQRQDFKVTRRATAAAWDFLCDNDGERIDMFMADNGMQCVELHKEKVGKCMKKSVPDFGDINTRSSYDASSLVTNNESCKELNAFHGCVVKYTERCDDPTPSNILDSLFTHMLKVTPCLQTSSAPAAGVLHLQPHLTFMTATLMTTIFLLC